MEYLPIFAQLKGRSCLVVGGGSVAERKVIQLLLAGAKITVLSKDMTERLKEFHGEGKIKYEVGPFSRADLAENWLVIAATDNRSANKEVAEAAEAERRLCNVVDDPELCSFIMPAIVDRDPITIAVGSNGQSPVISRWVKGIIESVLPARLGSLGRLAGRWRGPVREAIEDTEQRRRFWEHMIAGPIPEQIFAGQDCTNALDAALKQWKEKTDSHAGQAYIVGAGPGSPDLITLRGRQLLSQAEVVLYDRLISTEVLAYARRDAELISVGKTPGQPSITQKQINRLMVQLVKEGKRVCRLKGGDPMVFGRAGEELEALAEAELPFQIVPGVSAVEGCAAYAGIPLTHRDMAHSVVLTTGQTQDGVVDLSGLRPGQTLALYMGVARYAAVEKQLVDNGHDPDTPVVIVERGTTTEQRVIATVLKTLTKATKKFEISPPALLLVGETIRYAERYSWFAPERLMIFRDEERPPLARVC